MNEQNPFASPHNMSAKEAARYRQDAPLYPFATAAKRATVTCGALGGSLGLQVLVVALVLSGMQDLGDLLGTLSGLLQLVAGIAFLMWIHRAYRNLPTLGGVGLNYSPGWAVGYFFIPILNLFRPYQVTREIYQVSRPDIDATDPSEWENAAVSPLVPAWWFVWIVPGIVIGIAVGVLAAQRGPQAVEESISMLSVVQLLISVTAGILCILVVQRITKMQEEKYERQAGADYGMGSVYQAT